jgi:hypothetical protein
MRDGWHAQWHESGVKVFAIENGRLLKQFRGVFLLLQTGKTSIE